MAKYSKAAGKSVKTAMRKMKKGKLTSGTSGKKVTSKKQAVAIGLSEAREKGAKVPAKKTAAKKKTTAKKATPAKKAATKKAAPKKVAAKKADSKKSTSKAAPKKKAAAKKSAPAKKKSTATPSKKSPAKKKSSSKKTASTSKAKMPGETSDTGAFVDNDANTKVDETITNNDISNNITPEAQEETAVFSGSQPDQKWMPEDLKASPHDPFHGNINPSKAKTAVKPSGKKPLWDSKK